MSIELLSELLIIFSFFWFSITIECDWSNKTISKRKITYHSLDCSEKLMDFNAHLFVEWQMWQPTCSLEV